MKHLFLTLLLVPLCGFAADLASRLEPLAAPSPKTGFSGIQVVDVRSGKTLYDSNADRLFLPASNLKILTSALAL